MKKFSSLPIPLIMISFLFMLLGCKSENNGKSTQLLLREFTIIHSEYHLEARMLGYFAEVGTRTPTLRANKGDRIRITLTNGETMTHDVALEKMGMKSGTILEKGSTTNITFW